MFNLAVSHTGSPAITVYPFNNGLKYTNPIPLPLGNGRAVTFDITGHVFVAHDMEPYLSGHLFNGGFGNIILTTTQQLTPSINGIATHENFLAIAYSLSPYIALYTYDSLAGLSTKASDPATLPTGIGNGIALSHVGYFVAIAHNTSPFVSVYPYTFSQIGRAHV